MERIKVNGRSYTLTVDGIHNYGRYLDLIIVDDGYDPDEILSELNSVNEIHVLSGEETIRVISDFDPIISVKEVENYPVGGCDSEGRTLKADVMIASSVEAGEGEEDAVS